MLHVWCVSSFSTEPSWDQQCCELSETAAGKMKCEGLPAVPGTQQVHKTGS